MEERKRRKKKYEMNSFEEEGVKKRERKRERDG